MAKKQEEQTEKRYEKMMGDQSEGKTKITNDEAQVLLKLGLSGADDNDKARKALNYYLYALDKKETISDEEAKTTLTVLIQSTTSFHRIYCNKILSKYTAKFDQFPSAEALRAEDEAKKEAVAA